jgi:nucleoid-associated protein YgaU
VGLFDFLFGKKKPAVVENPPIIYRTGSGETLRKLAKKFYGDAGLYMKIYERNARILEDAEGDIFPGTELTIPQPTFNADGTPITPPAMP